MKAHSPFLSIVIAVLYGTAALAADKAGKASSNFDHKFVSEASQSGLKEVELSQAATQSSTSQEVKDFAAMMVKDHSKANDELKAVVANLKLSMEPALTGEHLEAVNRIRGKSGADFDAAYTKEMVKDHKDAVKLFEEAASQAEAPALKEFASKHLPTLKHHLEEAEAMNNKTKEAKPVKSKSSSKNS